MQLRRVGSFSWFESGRMGQRTWAWPAPARHAWQSDTDNMSHIVFQIIAWHGAFHVWISDDFRNRLGSTSRQDWLGQGQRIDKDIIRITLQAETRPVVCFDGVFAGFLSFVSCWNLLSECWVASENFRTWRRCCSHWPTAFGTGCPTAFLSRPNLSLPNPKSTWSTRSTRSKLRWLRRPTVLRTVHDTSMSKHVVKHHAE